VTYIQHIHTHVTSGQLQASHHGGPGSIPGHSMENFCWIKWHWNSVFCECVNFTLSVSLYLI